MCKDNVFFVFGKKELPVLWLWWEFGWEFFVVDVESSRMRAAVLRQEHGAVQAGSQSLGLGLEGFVG